MTDAPIITSAGPCPNGCAPRITIHGTDGTHMGYALVLLRAKWSGDDASTQTVHETLGAHELIRSAVELALSLTMSSVQGLSGLDDPAAARAVDRSTATGWLESMADTYDHQRNRRAARLSRDLATILSSDGPADRLTLHNVDLATALYVCSGLVQMTEEHRGIRAARQFEAYEQVTLAAHAA